MDKGKGMGGLLAILAPKQEDEGSEHKKLAADIIRAVKGGNEAELADALKMFVQCCGEGEPDEDD